MGNINIRISTFQDYEKKCIAWVFDLGYAEMRANNGKKYCRDESDM